MTVCPRDHQCVVLLTRIRLSFASLDEVWSQDFLQSIFLVSIWMRINSTYSIGKELSRFFNLEYFFYLRLWALLWCWTLRLSLKSDFPPPLPSSKCTLGPGNHREQIHLPHLQKQQKRKQPTKKTWWNPVMHPRGVEPHHTWNSNLSDVLKDMFKDKLSGVISDERKVDLSSRVNGSN
jgi:hypothetical protein